MEVCCRVLQRPQAAKVVWIITSPFSRAVSFTLPQVPRLEASVFEAGNLPHEEILQGQPTIQEVVFFFL